MKKTNTGRGTFAGFAGIALLVLTASAVWACTAQPRIFSLGPQVGPVGLEITLEGQATSGVPVEVRWNSLHGAKIGEGLADSIGNFAVSATIPDARPGIYFLVVAAGEAGVVRTPFEVTGERALGASGAAPGADSAAFSADLWSAFGDTAEETVPGTGAAISDERPGAQALAGTALLAAGLAALASGLVLARRRSRSAP